MSEPFLNYLPGESEEARRERFIEYAIEVWADDDLQVFYDAEIFEPEDTELATFGEGVWVQAWVWIAFDQEDDNG